MQHSLRLAPVFADDTENDEVHSLNSTAASVWICCDGKHSIREIAVIVEKHFKSESKPVLRDIIKTIKDFSKDIGSSLDVGAVPAATWYSEWNELSEPSFLP